MPLRHGSFPTYSSECKANATLSSSDPSSNNRWGGPPAIALISDYYRCVLTFVAVVQRSSSLGSYKRESYRGTVHAPRVLADHNFTVILKVRTIASVPPSTRLTILSLDRPSINQWTLSPLRSTGSISLWSFIGTRACFSNYCTSRCRWPITSPR
jgi:hypothetical protein